MHIECRFDTKLPESAFQRNLAVPWRQIECSIHTAAGESGHCVQRLNEICTVSMQAAVTDVKQLGSRCHEIIAIGQLALCFP